MKSIYYEPANDISEYGNGGKKRSFQIYSLLKKQYDLIESKHEKFGFESALKRYYKGYKFLKKSFTPIKSLHSVATAGYLYTNIERIVNKSSSVKCLVWESSIIDHFIRPLVYKEFGIKLISFPHNIESLVPNQYSPVSHKISPNWLSEELELLKQCEHVFTISREEHWLLTLHGIKCSYFPYYPSPQVEKNLIRIRNSRTNKSHEDYFLIFGSYYYAPIGEGILQIVNYIINKKINITIKIAGFRTEEISKTIPSLPPNIEILGTISDEALDDLYLNCKGVIINQSTSSGALTKVTELKIAGIPIFGNTLSFRSNYSKGCYTFENLDEMFYYLNSTSDFDMPQNDINIDIINKEASKILSELI